MPYAGIATKQALYALGQLHSELAGKLLDSKAVSHRLTVAMLQVEAVMKMLEPGFNLQSIAVRRRKPNPWFRRGTVYRAALEVLRAAPGPMTAREIAEAMLAAKGITGVPRRQISSLGQGVLSSFRNHKDRAVVVVGDGLPARWTLNEG
jgi:hypothetical protein